MHVSHLFLTIFDVCDACCSGWKRIFLLKRKAWMDSFSAWLRDDDSPVVARLSKLIEAATSLSMKTAEDLQVGGNHVRIIKGNLLGNLIRLQIMVLEDIMNHILTLPE